MLEESNMDKKSLNRSSQPQSRASAIDCKKGTEVTFKPWPKSSNKREGSGATPKNEPYRKNGAVQRGKGQIDRKPRARGNPSNLNMGGTENPRIEEDDEPEFGSVFVPGSKKQNLNHLLNFMYPSPRGPDRRGPQPRRMNQRQVSHRYEHDLYLRAYCQFVVREGEYRDDVLDPDEPLKWEKIEEIVVRGTGKSECPICLGTPVAARVGACGHVYCWACILHYSAAHEKQPPPCPVCTTPLFVRAMKPTIMLQWDQPGEQVTMRLVRRVRGSTVVELAPPRGQVSDAEVISVLPVEHINKAPYCKLFSASKQQLQEIIERDRSELQNQIMAEIDTTEIVYLEKALEFLKLKEEELNSQDIGAKVAAKVEDSVPTVYEKVEFNQNKMDWFDVTEEGAACIENIQEEMGQLDIAAQPGLNPEAAEFNIRDINDNQPANFTPTIECEIDDNFVTDIDKQNQIKYFYFYQAEDGQQVFLNSLNVRMLNASWGTLAAAPLVIQGRVLHRDTLSLTEQTRKHIPFTAHLPLNCSFEIVELDLQLPHVTNAALKSFAEELDRRSRTRARHEREERRRERAYRRATEGPPRPDFSSELMFPAPSHMSPPSDPIPFQIPVVESHDLAGSSGSGPSGLSFAKMAQTGGTWRVRTPVQEAPPEPAEESTGPRALSLSDAIEAAFCAAPSPQSSKKNKKNKQKVLFATGMHRAA